MLSEVISRRAEQEQPFADEAGDAAMETGPQETLVGMNEEEFRKCSIAQMTVEYSRLLSQLRETGTREKLALPTFQEFSEKRQEEMLEIYIAATLQLRSTESRELLTQDFSAYQEARRQNKPDDALQPWFSNIKLRRTEGAARLALPYFSDFKTQDAAGDLTTSG